MFKAMIKFYVKHDSSIGVQKANNCKQFKINENTSIILNHVTLITNIVSVYASLAKKKIGKNCMHGIFFLNNMTIEVHTSVS